MQLTLPRLPYQDYLEELYNQVKMYLPLPDAGVTRRAVLVGVSAGLVVYLVTRKRYKLPPGPRGWPLLGSILEFRNTTIYEKLIKWQDKYGDIIRFRVGPETMIALNSTEVVYEALVKRQADFAGRPQYYSTRVMSDGGKSITFGDYSPTWKLNRKIATKALRYYMGGRHLEEGIENSLAKGVELILQHKEPLDPTLAINLIVFNILNNICFSYSCEESDPYYHEMMEALAVNEDFGNGFIEDFFPPLRLFPTSKMRKLMHTVDRVMALINDNIDKHRASFSKDHIRDFCDAVLLSQREAKEEEDPELMSQITDAHVTQILLAIFGAGIDTSRFTLAWSLLYIAGHPDVQTRLHKEIDETLGSRVYPRLSDRDGLQYTDAVLHEVLRISSVAPLSLPHTTICDTSVGGYDIPKGAMVIPNLYAMHHDQASWGDPEVFRPDRFLDQNGKMAPKPDSWLPFSAGRRVCLGESVAKPELHLLLAGIMRHFKISAPPGVKLTYDCKEGSLLRIAKDFKLSFESRMYGH